MKNSYIAVTICEDGKYYSYVLTVSHSVNLLSALTIKGICSATICDSKKAAAAIVEAWNKGYKRNGVCLYGEVSA